MQQIVRYAFFWNIRANEGHIVAHLADETCEMLPIDSPQEGSLLLDLLRGDETVYYDRANGLISSGVEAPGDVEVDAGGDAGELAAAS